MRRDRDDVPVMPADAPDEAGTATRPAAQSVLRMAVQQDGGGVGLHDISGGLEPVPIPVDRKVEGQALLRFRQTLHCYVTDSVLPDGRGISEISFGDVRKYNGGESLGKQGESDDDLESVGSDPGSDQEGCGCTCASSATACSVQDSDSCDCVAAFGNFYRWHTSSTSQSQVLQLDALPENWPLVECGPACGCGMACANRETQRGVRAAVVVAASKPRAGLGLFYRPSHTETLPRGTFICLYAGEYLSAAETQRRLATQAAAANAGESLMAGQGNYILSLRLPSGTTHIDARRIGNVGRILNHSCEPTCVILPVRWGTGPDVLPRAAIFANKDIIPGEELCYDYADASGSTRLQGRNAGRERDWGAPTSMSSAECVCGSEKCRGWMPADETL